MDGTRTNRRRSSVPIASMVAALLVLGTGLDASALPAQEHSVPTAVSDAYDPTSLTDLGLTMDPADWDLIRADITNELMVPAQLSTDGGDPILVGVRRKSSRALPSEADPHKVGLKIDVSAYVSGQRWNGVSKLSLENGGDVSPVAEGLAWYLHELASVANGYGSGYDAALAGWATVAVNGEQLGLYTNVEQRNTQFLRNRSMYVSNNTWLYKQGDIGGVEIEVGSGLSPTVQALCYLPFGTGVVTTGKKTTSCRTPADSVLTTQLPALIDMDTLLTLGAVDAFIANNDSLFPKGKNFFYADTSYTDGPLRRYYPWDLDAVFRTTTWNIYSVGSTTAKKGVTTYTQGAYQKTILNHPVFRARFNAILSGLLADRFSVVSLVSILDELQPVLAAAIAADPYSGSYASEGAAAHFDSLRAWVRARVPEVLRQIAANVPAPRA